MNHDNVVDINQKPSTPSETKPFSIDDAQNRKEQYCVARKKYVTEYQMPLDQISTDEISQNRDTDSPPGQVSQLANDLNTVGQIKGICVQKVGDIYYVRWGNTRFRAALSLESVNETIENCKPGHIWVSFYEELPSKIRWFQARENNSHPTATPANIEDNIRSLRSVIADGQLDYAGEKYIDCDNKEKRKRVLKAVKDIMPTWAGQKFKTLWKRFEKQTKSTFQVHSYDLKDMKYYFVKHNNYGITDLNQALKINNHYVFEVYKDINGNPCSKKLLYVGFANGYVWKGATIQSCWKAKYVTYNCDEAIIIVATDAATSKSLESQRKQDCQWPQKWNDSVNSDQKYVDATFYLPQTIVEKASVNKWALVIEY